MSEALNGHEGDKAALLQAINEVAQGLNRKPANRQEQSAMMKDSNVALSVARDLTRDNDSRGQKL